MAVVGKRTSVYLSDGLAAAVEASGVPLAELIRRGLGAPLPPAAAVPARPAPARPRSAELPPAGPVRPAARRRCPHPGTRVIGGWCRQCDAMVEPGGYLPG